MIKGQVRGEPGAGAGPAGVVPDLGSVTARGGGPSRRAIRRRVRAKEYVAFALCAAPNLALLFVPRVVGVVSPCAFRRDLRDGAGGARRRPSHVQRQRPLDLPRRKTLVEEGPDPRANLLVGRDPQPLEQPAGRGRPVDRLVGDGSSARRARAVRLRQHRLAARPAAGQCHAGWWAGI